MNNQYCAHIDIPVPLLNPEVAFQSHLKWNHSELDKIEHIHPKMHVFLAKHNLTIYKIELFYTPPNHQTHPHADGFGGDLGKINWIIGGKQSLMKWYNIISESKKESGLTDIATDLIIYERNEIELAYQEEIKSPSIVQVGIPHNINNKEEERWCISLILHDPQTNNHISFTRLKEIFAI